MPGPQQTHPEDEPSSPDVIDLTDAALGLAQRPAQRVLVTGAAGFIGSHVTEALLRRGDNVVGLDNFDDFYHPAVKRSNIAWAKDHPNCVVVEGDIRDPMALHDAFSYAPVDAIIHLAARAGVRPSIVDPLLYQSVNGMGTVSVLEAARERGIGRMVFGSSSSVYGATSPVPFTEEGAADRPSSPYAATKRANEVTCYSYHHLFGMDISCLRFFTVYGPRQRPEMAIHRFTRLISSGEPVELFGDGNSRRDYTYIDDIVDGILRALDRPNGFRIYNLGTTATTRLGDLVALIAERLDRPLRVRHQPDQPGDVPLTFADITRAKEELGYHPSTRITEGLDRFVAWYRREVLSGKSRSGNEVAAIA